MLLSRRTKYCIDVAKREIFSDRPLKTELQSHDHWIICRPRLSYDIYFGEEMFQFVSRRTMELVSQAGSRRGCFSVGLLTGQRSMEPVELRNEVHVLAGV